MAVYIVSSSPIFKSYNKLRLKTEWFTCITSIYTVTCHACIHQYTCSTVTCPLTGDAPFACYIYYPYTPRPARTYLPVGDGPFALASLGLAGRLDDHQASLFFHLLRDLRQVFLGWPHHLDGVHLLELQQLVPGKPPLQHHHDLSPLWKESVLERGQHFTYLRSIFMSHLYVKNCISWIINLHSIGRILSCILSKNTQELSFIS